MFDKSFFRFNKKSSNDLEGGTEAQNTQNPSLQDRLWTACPACKNMILKDDLNENLRVCPQCGHYFRVTARDRIRITLDSGSFQEIDADLQSDNVLHFPEYENKLKKARETTRENESVVCGLARIGGFPCAVFVMDGGFMMGSMGIVTGEKIARLFELAERKRLPVIGFCVSGGARMQEGMCSLMQMAKTSAAVRRHSDKKLLYVSVLTDPTTGGVTASFAMLGDIILAEPRALIGFAGPRVIEQTINRTLPEGFQQSEFLLEKGFLDDIVARKDMRRYLTNILRIHKV